MSSAVGLPAGERERERKGWESRRIWGDKDAWKERGQRSKTEERECRRVSRGKEGCRAQVGRFMERDHSGRRKLKEVGGHTKSTTDE